MNLISETGVPIKEVGSALASREVNQINTTVNQEVAVGNYYLRNECNINAEVGDYSKQFTLQEAINIVPEDRRTPGMKVRFRNISGDYSEFIFCGLPEESWTNTNLWRASSGSIDGGEW